MLPLIEDSRNYVLLRKPSLSTYATKVEPLHTPEWWELKSVIAGGCFQGQHNLFRRFDSRPDHVPKTDEHLNYYQFSHARRFCLSHVSVQFTLIQMLERNSEQPMQSPALPCTLKLIMTIMIEHIQGVPKRCIHKVNIPYYNVYTSFLGYPV
jgi:hypothetical protein